MAAAALAPGCRAVRRLLLLLCFASGAELLVDDPGYDVVLAPSVAFFFLELAFQFLCFAFSFRAGSARRTHRLPLGG